MPDKYERWFASIKWTDSCIKCQMETGGVCTRKHCAEFHYDEWGDPIPEWLYHCDGSCVVEYIEKKRRRMETALDEEQRDFYDDLRMEQREQM